MSKKTSMIAVACLGLSVGAHAEEFKCSAPSVIDTLRDNLLEAAAISWGPMARYRQLDVKEREEIKQARFGSADPILSFTDFIGKAEDESTRDCTATVRLGGVGKIDANIQIGYKVMKTEEDKIIASGNLRIYEILLVEDFDRSNGNYEAIDGEANPYEKIDRANSAAEMLRKSDAILGGAKNTPMPSSTGGGSSFTSGRPSTDAPPLGGRMIDQGAASNQK